MPLSHLQIDTSLQSFCSGTRSPRSARAPREYSFSDDTLVTEPKVAVRRASSTSCSLSDASSVVQRSPSCMSEITLVSASSRRGRFRASQLGRPPGQASPRQSEPALSKIVSNTLFTENSRAKQTIPLKELQKMITDLQKENFDLKLRLFHLETSLTLGVFNHDKKESKYAQQKHDLDKQEENTVNLEHMLVSDSVKDRQSEIDIKEEREKENKGSKDRQEDEDEDYHTAQSTSPESLSSVQTLLPGVPNISPQKTSATVDQIQGFLFDLRARWLNR